VINMVQDDEVYNPPNPGYEEALESVMFVPLINTFKYYMKASGYFDHVSAWFNHLTAVEVDNAFPNVQFSIPDGNFEQIALTKGYKDCIVTFEIHYFTKKLYRGGEPEVYHFIEKTIEIVETYKKVKFKYKPDTDTSNCDIREASVDSFFTEFDYDGNYIIRHGVVTSTVRLPLCKHLGIT